MLANILGIDVGLAYQSPPPSYCRRVIDRSDFPRTCPATPVTLVPATSIKDKEKIVSLILQDFGFFKLIPLLYPLRSEQFRKLYF